MLRKMVGKLPHSIPSVIGRDLLSLSSKLTTTYSVDTRTYLGIVSIANAPAIILERKWSKHDTLRAEQLITTMEITLE